MPPENTDNNSILPPSPLPQNPQQAVPSPQTPFATPTASSQMPIDGISKPSRPTSLKIFIIGDLVFYSLVFGAALYFFLLNSYFPKGVNYFFSGTIAVIALWFYITDISLWFGKKWALKSRNIFNILNAGGIGIGLLILIIVAAFLARPEIQEYFGIPIKSKRFSNIAFVAIIFGMFVFIVIAYSGFSKFLGTTNKTEKVSDSGSMRYEQIKQIGKTLTEHKNNSASYPKNLTELNLPSNIGTKDFTYKLCNRIDSTETIIYIKLLDGKWVYDAPGLDAGKNSPQYATDEPTCYSIYKNIDLLKAAPPDYPKAFNKGYGSSMYDSGNSYKRIYNSYSVKKEDVESNDVLNFYSKWIDEFKVNSANFWSDKEIAGSRILIACNKELRLIFLVNVQPDYNSTGVQSMSVEVSSEKDFKLTLMGGCKKAFSAPY